MHWTRRQWRVSVFVRETLVNRSERGCKGSSLVGQAAVEEMELHRLGADCVISRQQREWPVKLAGGYLSSPTGDVPAAGESGNGYLGPAFVCLLLGESNL